MATVAVIGGGIAGLAAARALAAAHRVTLIEAAPRPGGHAHTVDVDGPHGAVAIDVGFIVCNRATYPRFFGLLDALGVATRPTSMSFSTRDGDREWATSGAATLREPRFTAAVMRFLAQARRDAGGALVRATTLDEYLVARRVDDDVRARFARPLAAALWSVAAERSGDFPAETWLRYLDAHGMLRPLGSLTWHTIAGGSRRYVDALIAATPLTLWTDTPARRLHRDAHGVTVETDGAQPGAHRFDAAVVALHADAALALLAEPSDDERAVLGAVRFADNRVLLHQDPAFLPRRARASWNYGAGTVTYWMNRLQGLDDGATYLVTLDPRGDARPADVLLEVTMAHPQLDRPALDALRWLWRIQGARQVTFAGAWCGFGFHEDGARAGEDAAARLARSLA